MLKTQLNELKSLKAKTDIIGKKFGRWEVVDFSYTRSNYCGHPRLHYFKCKCDCGTIKNIRKDRLTGGQTTGCDCIRREAISLPNGYAAFNSLYRAYRHNARTRGLNFDLTEQQFKELTSSNCFYCGKLPTRKHIHDKHQEFKNGDYYYNGIDRKDNVLGYVFDNCLPSCRECNISKSTRSFIEYKEWIKKSYFHLKEKGEIDD